MCHELLPALQVHWRAESQAAAASGAAAEEVPVSTDAGGIFAAAVFSDQHMEPRPPQAVCINAGDAPAKKRHKCADMPDCGQQETTLSSVQQVLPSVYCYVLSLLRKHIWKALSLTSAVLLQASLAQQPQTHGERMAAAQHKLENAKRAVAAAHDNLTAAQRDEVDATVQLRVLQRLEDILKTEFGAQVSAQKACVLVYVDIPVTDHMRQRAAEVLAAYPGLKADILEGSKVHSQTAGQQLEALEGPRPQAVASVRMDEASLTILARGLAAPPTASTLGHQHLELSVRILLLEGYATVVLQLLMAPCQAGLWAGTVQLPPGYSSFRYVQLEAGRWVGDPLVTFSLRWACMA